MITGSLLLLCLRLNVAFVQYIGAVGGWIDKVLFANEKWSPIICEGKQRSAKEYLDMICF
jgi:hypothetical protein